MGWEDVDWGNAPSWAAFVTAVFAATFAVRAYQREERRDRLKSTFEIREQATKVGAWLETNEASSVLVRIMNVSDLPVPHASLEVHLTWGPVASRSLHRIHQDGTRIAETRKVFDLGMLPPKHDHSMPIPLDAEQAVATVRLCKLSLYFADAQGVTWSRTEGHLAAQNWDHQPDWLAEVLSWDVNKESWWRRSGVADYERWYRAWFSDALRWLPEAMRGDRRPFPRLPRRRQPEPPPVSPNVWHADMRRGISLTKYPRDSASEGQADESD